MNKKELRKQIREIKKLVSLDEKMHRSAAIMHHVEQLPQFQQASTILLYWSMDDEVHTHDFVVRWYQKKVMLLPCVEGDDLVLRRYTGPACMKAGEQFGIEEPIGSTFDDLDSIDVIVVPGVAFDSHNNRMGRGRGFYDRLLKNTPNAFKVGVAFNFQVVEEIPIEPFDVPMDTVVSED